MERENSPPPPRQLYTAPCSRHSQDVPVGEFTPASYSSFLQKLAQNVKRSIEEESSSPPPLHPHVGGKGSLPPQSYGRVKRESSPPPPRQLRAAPSPGHSLPSPVNIKLKSFNWSLYLCQNAVQRKYRELSHLSSIILKGRHILYLH